MRHGDRLTIAMLTSQLNRGFHRAAFFGVAEAARAGGANLICYDGGVLAPSGSPSAAANVLYDLVDHQALDGVVMWSSALDWEVGAEQTEALCRSFTPLPVVSVGRAFPGIPSVLVDNYQGMAEAVRHLIEGHGHERIAFLRGPEGAREEELRFQAYQDVLAEHGLPFNARLVSRRTNWERSDGPVAIKEFLDARGLRAGVDFQAILSVGDDLACGALETLQARGVRVPDQVAVIGFNDDEEGRAILPALTTVRQPVEEMGRCAVSALLDLIHERPAPEVVTLPLDLRVRRSCGCLAPSVLGAGARAVAGARQGVTPALNREALAAEMARQAGTHLEHNRARELIDGFCREVEGDGAGEFLGALNSLLQQDALAGHDISRWHLVLSAMRSRLLAALPGHRVPAAEDLWQQGRVLVSEIATQGRTYQRFCAEQDTRLLSEFSQRIQTAADRAALLDILAADLPSLGALACYLVLYDDHEHPAGLAGLIFACDAGSQHVAARQPIPPGGVHFPAPQILPPGVLAAYDPLRLIVLPLYFQRGQLGYLVLQVDARGAAFAETFREQISTALAGLFLREELRRAWQQAEDANRLKSRFLATVSHELRTPLSLIVGTIEMMQRAESLGGSAPSVASFLNDLDSIRASAQHLTHLIGDVLDLASSQAGELRLVCEPLQLTRLLDEVAVLGEPLAREKGLIWQTSLPQDLPMVWGDRTRLRQVILNLVSNAVKFTERGTITLWAEAGMTDVLVAVSDTGLGIAPDEQDAIFDEFRRSEQAARRGYLGMGLGLAISRRLVELHGGKIGTLSSGSEGAGSTFYFTLPILAEAPAALHTSAAAQTVLLLVERRGDGARVAQALSDRGFRVDELATAQNPDWLGQVVAALPGAVVLDYEPAAERGWELMQMLRRNPATQDIPVLFYALLADQEHGAILKLDYLTKPAEAAELSRALRRHGFAPGHTTGRTILAVDDDPGMLALHTRTVEAHLPGCRILQARDGCEALEIMQETVPDLMLLDLMMPRLDGFGVLQAMREREATRLVPVIVLTAQILSAEDMDRLQSGVASVLTKGLLTTDEMLDHLAGALAATKRLGSEAQRLVRATMAYIHQHYAEPISRTELAAHACVNERYLTRCFRQETGLTPVTYLNRYRIRQARILLETPQASITEVALQTGFSDSNYFTRIFQREVGVTPAAYRRGERPATIPQPSPEYQAS
jgi:signal transduction histidine kinase/DNA-binding LacI/PurR family transcriptional regulator/AraC-like DNA-binding protein